MSELESLEKAADHKPRARGPNETSATGYASQPIKAPPPVSRSETYFSIYGLNVRVIGPTSIAQDLAADFSHFVTAVIKRPAPAPDLTIEIRQHKFIIKPEKFLKTKNYTVYGRSLQRFVEYNDGSKVIVTHNLVDGRLVSIMAHEASRSYELAYLVLHSFIGEKLEARGQLRLHALAFNHSRRDAILFLPSGGGKSTLAALMIQKPDFQIYSDEVTLIEDLRLLAYPWRIGLDPMSAEKLGLPTTENRQTQRLQGRAKYLLPIPANKIADANLIRAEENVFDEGLEAKRPVIYWGLIQGVAAENAAGLTRPLVRPALFKEKMAFVRSVVLGLGLMQMAEYIIRTDNYRALFLTGVRRLVWALKAMGRLRVIEVTRDYDKVLSVLGDDLKTNPAHQPST